MSASHTISVDEYWQNHPELHDIPIYYASSLAKKCMAVYQTYVNAMNDKIRKQININNPFVFKHISNLKVMPVEEGRQRGVGQARQTAALLLRLPTYTPYLGAGLLGLTVAGPASQC